MKITVKTTQQKVFQIDVEGSDTVGDLKTKIHESQGHPAASQKIIYSGKILTDDKTIESCGIKEKDFLVLMVSKPKPTPTPIPASSSTPAPQPVAPAPVPAPAPESTPASSAPAPAPDAPAAVPAVPAPAATPAAAPAFGDTSSFLSGEALQATINNMIEMGFPREQVLRAMRASFNNADRAVEYLMTGIPAHLEAEAAPQVAAPAAQPATAPAQAAAPTSAAPASQPGQPQNLFQLAQQQQQSGGGGGGGGNPAGQRLDLAALQNNPQIQQLRQQMTENPAMVQPLIQQLAAQNPAIAQMFSQNPAALLQLLGIPESDVDFDSEEGGVPPGAQVISVTEEERAAIQRLEALGFSRQAAVEAYFACDKNEDLAANYLFESNFED